MNRTVFLIFALTTLGCGATPDQSADSNARARDILAAVAETAGGDSALANVVTLVAQYEFSQTGGAGSPAPFEVLQARDFSTGRNLYEVHQASPQKWDRVVMAPGRAFAVNLLTNQTTHYDTPAAAMAEYSELQLRWYVYQPVNQARTRASTLRHLGDSTIGGQVHDVISFLHDGLGEIRLAVNRETGQLHSQSWSLPGPTPRTASLEYRDYTVVDGYPMPMTVILQEQGAETARYDMMGVQVNVVLQEAAFQPIEPSN